jgi:hypothetical protein
VLWVSHIVITYDGASFAGSRLRNMGWQPDAQPTRSEDEAYKLIKHVEEVARANPSSFEELARTYSDDVVTRDHGGSLGGVHATQLPPTFVDALEALQPGAVSEIIQTPMGFHVLLRRAPPPDEAVNGARVVLRYRTTLGDGPAERSREDALKLARAIVEEARSGADFDDLVMKYSDNPDRERKGALGVWQTRGPKNTPLVLEQLARLEIGQVSEPIDTSLGIQIVKKLPLVAPTDFAIRAIRIPYQRDTSDSDTLSEGAAYGEAARAAAALRKNPNAFHDLAETYGGDVVERWTDGHGDPAVTGMLERLSLGEVAPTPMKVAPCYLVLQRIDPDLAPRQESYVFELPHPSTADADTVISLNSSGVLLQRTAPMMSALEHLALSQGEREVLGRAVESFRRDLSTADSPASRVLAYHAALISIHRGVSEARYAYLLHAIEVFISNQLLELPQQG